MRIALNRPSTASLLFLFGAAVVGGALWARRRAANAVASADEAHHEATDQHRDDTLQDTYPASDAPATHNYEIPVNAR